MTAASVSFLIATLLGAVVLVLYAVMMQLTWYSSWPRSPLVRFLASLVPPATCFIVWRTGAKQTVSFFLMSVVAYVVSRRFLG